jgi:hypothetical protein
MIGAVNRAWGTATTWTNRILLSCWFKCHSFSILEFSRLSGLQALLGNGSLPPYIFSPLSLHLEERSWSDPSACSMRLASLWNLPNPSLQAVARCTIFPTSDTLFGISRACATELYGHHNFVVILSMKSFSPTHTIITEDGWREYLTIQHYL